MRYAVNLFGESIFQDSVTTTADIILLTNASELFLGITDKHNPLVAPWVKHRRVYINVLKAVFLSIHSFCRNWIYKHARTTSYSSAVVAYINNKSDIKSKKYSEKKKEMWLWFFKNNSFISAAHIPGKHSIEVDQFSRTFNNTDWQPNPTILRVSLTAHKLIFLLAE